MRWIALILGLGCFAAACVFAYPDTPSAIEMAVATFGLLLLLDWCFEQPLGYVAWGLELHRNDIKADFYSKHRSLRRYALAAIIAGAMACSFGLSSSEILQATTLIGGFIVYGIAAFADALKSRRTIANSNRPPIG
jgi:hypothetical protein